MPARVTELSSRTDIAFRIRIDAWRDGWHRDVDFFPSLGLTLIAGLLAIGLNPAFHNAGWAWIKLVSGLLVFEWGFAGILGPMQEEAELSARALADAVDPAKLALSLDAEWKSLWVMLAIATVNVILGIWRPRLTRLPD